MSGATVWFAVARCIRGFVSLTNAIPRKNVGRVIRWQRALATSYVVGGERHRFATLEGRCAVPFPMERSRRNVVDGAPLRSIADAEKRHLWERIRAQQRRPVSDVIFITAITDGECNSDASPGETTYEFAVPHTC